MCWCSMYMCGGQEWKEQAQSCPLCIMQPTWVQARLCGKDLLFLEWSNHRSSFCDLLWVPTSDLSLNVLPVCPIIYGSWLAEITSASLLEQALLWRNIFQFEMKCLNEVCWRLKSTHTTDSGWDIWPHAWRPWSQASFGHTGCLQLTSPSADPSPFQISYPGWVSISRRCAAHCRGRKACLITLDCKQESIQVQCVELHSVGRPTFSEWIINYVVVWHIYASNHTQLSTSGEACCHQSVLTNPG